MIALLYQARTSLQTTHHVQVKWHIHGPMRTVCNHKEQRMMADGARVFGLAMGHQQPLIKLSFLWRAKSVIISIQYALIYVQSSKIELCIAYVPGKKRTSLSMGCTPEGRNTIIFLYYRISSWICNRSKTVGAIPSQESEQLCICELEVLILPLSTILIFEFGIVPTLWYLFVFHFNAIHNNATIIEGKTH